jgi:hypothetical protein
MKMLNDIEVLGQPDTNYWTSTATACPIRRTIPSSLARPGFKMVTNVRNGDSIPAGKQHRSPHERSDMRVPPTRMSLRSCGLRLLRAECVVSKTQQEQHRSQKQPFHSITSSARASRETGTVCPSGLLSWDRLRAVFCGLLHRHIGGLFARENTSSIHSRLIPTPRPAATDSIVTNSAVF